MRTTRTIALAAALTFAACSSTGADPANTAPTPAPATPAPTPAAPSTGMDAVYTAEQADEGELLFRDFCSGCHSPSEFQGQGFLGSWGGRTAYDLHGFISQNMPEDAPGMLSPQEYADIVAYVFELNDVPAGGDPLLPDEARLRLIRIPGR
ncbi:MAG: cytochrome c [Gemmatimonadetes bacterium]|nr:cytochrome c [Gemmatimonadota bacterium]